MAEMEEVPVGHTAIDDRRRLLALLRFSIMSTSLRGVRITMRKERFW
jgi:hypothetical protein